MTTETLFCSSCRNSFKRLIISACVIVAIGIGIYFIFVLANQKQFENDDFINDSTPKTEKWVLNKEIQILRRYLRFPTISPVSNYGPCVEFLKRLAQNLSLEVSVHYPANKQNPVVLMTWQGQQPELPSILLNSHMDVVPVVEEYWKYSPFGAHIDENGNIYARGSQDMKSVGVQYLAAIRALKRKGITQLKRTIHLTYVPDEETGGEFGMQAFVQSDEFKSLNVGCALDEGYPSESNELEVFYQAMHPSHASLLLNDTAAEKLNYVMNKFSEFRRIELRKLNKLNYPYGNVTTINLTMLKGGVRWNVVSPEMSAIFSMRLSIDIDTNKLERTIIRWTKEAGENVTVDIKKGTSTAPTSIDDANRYWVAFKKATDQMNLSIKPAVFRAATDSEYLRALNISAFGFSPLMNTSPMLHEHNEFINADIYLKGIDIFEKIIETIANES